MVTDEETEEWWRKRAEKVTLSPRYSPEQRELSRRIGMLMTDPAGAYIRAKDECSWYQGPDWVPFNLWQTAEYGGNSDLERECAKVLISAPGAEKLWADIAKRYSRNPVTGEADPHRPSWMSSTLPTACANAKAGWLSIPRLTPNQFKDQRDELARRADQLAVELERFYLPRDADEHELPGLLEFQQLMTDEELNGFDQAVRITTARIVNRARDRVGAPMLEWEQYNDIGEDARKLGYQNERPYESNYVRTFAREDAHEVYPLIERDHTRPDLPYGGVPTLPDMLRRIARKFREDGDDPPIKSPNLATAERSFFARELCKYFWKSYGDVSPAIIRDIVAMFYDGGVTEGNVSQIIAKVKAAHPLLPADPYCDT